ncbi:glutathione peroxidase [Caenimonas koreensis DSM 17982]|uniref:Glutathione peroxidase n=1 Tax=Caenimonas koreensis DSM 17982 TaxID=1121255 RepID=A0A844BAI6_9BURK|nr:glutathione peroxidase [Caenimonas koreensis]MRD48599.1 glutathione peroxidase [Caenimonas koreensis DSM 17982]
MLNTFRLIAVLAASAAALAAIPAGAATAPAAGAAAACPATLSHTFLRLQDEKPQSLCQYAGKVVLVVNTASYCGFTPQYKGLESLYDKYKDKGLVVLGFPSNDFSQEKGSNKEIAEFCENTFNVKFPMFGASSVRGDAANPLFKQLAAATGTSPKWNFYKYMLARDGKVVGSWSSMTTPEALEKDLQKQLAMQ